MFGRRVAKLVGDNRGAVVHAVVDAMVHARPCVSISAVVSTMVGVTRLVQCSLHWLVQKERSL